jgi:hypothetical protein
MLVMKLLTTVGAPEVPQVRKPRRSFKDHTSGGHETCSQESFMTNFEQELAETYREFADEYLLDKWESGTLTDLAMKVAGEELTRRGIPHHANPQHEEDCEPGIGEIITFETVAQSLNTSAIYVLRARLEAEGIPSWVADTNLNQVYLSGAARRARLLVPSKYSAAAKAIIADINSGALALDSNAAEPRVVIAPTDKAGR